MRNGQLQFFVFGFCLLLYLGAIVITKTAITLVNNIGGQFCVTKGGVLSVVIFFCLSGSFFLVGASNQRRILPGQ